MQPYWDICQTQEICNKKAHYKHQVLIHRSYQTLKAIRWGLFWMIPHCWFHSVLWHWSLWRDLEKKWDYSFWSQTLLNISDNTAFHTLVNIAALVLVVFCGQRRAEPFMNACVVIKPMTHIVGLSFLKTGLVTNNWLQAFSKTIYPLYTFKKLIYCRRTL